MSKYLISTIIIVVKAKYENQYFAHIPYDLVCVLKCEIIYP